MNWLIGIAVTGLSFLLQVRPRLIKKAFGVDSWRHLDEADYIRRFRHLPRGMAERYLIDKPSDYPPFLRIVLALVPKKMLEQFEWMVAPIFDACHILLLFGAVLIWTGRVEMAVCAQLTYALSPLVIMENSNLTTRSFASLLFTLGWLPLMLYRAGQGTEWLAAGIFFLAVLFLTHRLALQALFFLSIAWSIFEKTWFFAGAISTAIFAAMIFSGGFYLKVLWGQLTMLNYWRINSKNRFAHQIRGLPKSSEQEPDIVFRIYQTIRKAPFLAIMGANPFMVFLLPWLFHPEWLHQDLFGIPAMVLSQFFFWACALWVIGLIIRQWEPVRFMGEGERYLEYACFPTAVLTAVLLARQSSEPGFLLWIAAFAVVAIAGGLIPGIFLQQQVIVQDTERSVTPVLQKVFDELNRMPDEVRIFTIPLYLASATVHFTKDRVKVLTTDSSYAHLTDLKDILPVLKIPLSEVSQRYRLTHMLISERYVTLSELGLSEKQLILRSGQFCLLTL